MTVTVGRALQGVGYAAIADRATAPTPITFEAEAEKPTRAATRKKAVADPEAELDDLDETPVDEVAAVETEAVADAAEEADAQAAPAKKKRTRRGTRGGRNRKKPGAAAATEATEATEETEAATSDDVDGSPATRRA